MKLFHQIASTLKCLLTENCKDISTLVHHLLKSQKAENLGRDLLQTLSKQAVLASAELISVKTGNERGNEDKSNIDVELTNR